MENLKIWLQAGAPLSTRIRKLVTTQPIFAGVIVKVMEMCQPHWSGPTMDYPDGRGMFIYPDERTFDKAFEKALVEFVCPARDLVVLNKDALRAEAFQHVKPWIEVNPSFQKLNRPHFDSSPKAI